MKTNFQNNLVIELSRLKPGNYEVTSGSAIKHKAPEELRASVRLRGHRNYHSESGTIILQPFNENDNELQITMDILLTPESTSNNQNTFNYKSTVTVKHCQKLDTTPSLSRLQNCSYI
jgi:hypothetical protein